MLQTQLDFRRADGSKLEGGMLLSAKTQLLGLFTSACFEVLMGTRIPYLRRKNSVCTVYVHFPEEVDGVIEFLEREYSLAISNVSVAQDSRGADA